MCCTCSNSIIHKYQTWFKGICLSQQRHIQLHSIFSHSNEIWFKWTKLHLTWRKSTTSLTFRPCGWLSRANTNTHTQLHALQSEQNKIHSPALIVWVHLLASKQIATNSMIDCAVLWEAIYSFLFLHVFVCTLILSERAVPPHTFTQQSFN